ncbi:PRO1 [Fusarium albosuccineum]|uniref:PRO1 n=1 Tax=Fusarium albosuccineum TaxID=1237068 RepID=A0A8H4L6D5_9HYPO|nr:PRO1 [Fusarium albosuccineum]
MAFLDDATDRISANYQPIQAQLHGLQRRPLVAGAVMLNHSLYEEPPEASRAMLLSYEPLVADANLPCPTEKKWEWECMSAQDKVYHRYLAWYDIFSSMAQRSMPMFASVYRRHLQLSVESPDMGIADTLGIWEETGCHSVVAYLVSEIAALE